MRVWLKKDGRWQIIAGSVSNGDYLDSAKVNEGKLLQADVQSR
jgi:hypothetical protein